MSLKFNNIYLFKLGDMARVRGQDEWHKVVGIEGNFATREIMIALEGYDGQFNQDLLELKTEEKIKHITPKEMEDWIDTWASKSINPNDLCSAGEVRSKVSSAVHDFYHTIFQDRTPSRLK